MEPTTCSGAAPAQLAALHRTAEDLARLTAGLDEMQAGCDRGDVDLFVEADIAFHDVVMRAGGNIFVPFMVEPFGDLLAHTRRQTSAVPDIQRNAIAHHQVILRRLAESDPEGSRAALEEHMHQTQDDLRRHVLTQPPAVG